VEDGEESPKLPQRPVLGVRPVPEDPENPPAEESYGRAYYDTHLSMRASAPPSSRKSSRARGGWLIFLLIGGAAAYCYFHPAVVSASVAAAERWVLSLRGEVFEEGRGYGDMPAAKGWETGR
jgi:hypothetical protein